MEKIIYNTKLKKILIVLMLVTLLSNFFLPVAIATNEVFDDDLQELFEPSWFYIKEPDGFSAVGFESFNPETESPQNGWNLEEYKLTNELMTKIYTIYSQGQGKSGQDKWDLATIQQGCASYNSALAENINNSLSVAMQAASTAGAQNINQIKDQQEITAVEGAEALSAVGEDLASKLGGMLLTPIFYLINFIADAITSNLGRIMIGNDASFGNVTGTTVLQGNEIPLEAGKEYYEYPVDMDKLSILGGVQYPNIPYTPEEIFAGKIDLLSIDFISAKVPQTDANGDIVKDANGNIVYTNNQNEGWINIRATIAQWYNVLKMVAIIGLMSVLIYTGIKIMISANAKDKAKYKEWIINWFMAVAILFAMHLIMAFIIAVTGELSGLISGTSQGVAINNGGTKSATNLMGLVRFMIQSEDFYMKIGYEAMYIALIVYTIKFTLIYLKRVLNMAFLTLIAPIVALTYPIDKINDGKAQGFDMWIKEYIFNALLQPMHLLMYYVLVGSAVSIAATNPIYGIAVLMFLTEAEKLLKRIFGFDKASGGTVGGMAGAFAAGAIASNIKNIAKLAGGKGSGGRSNVESENNLLSNVKPEKEKPITDTFSNNMLDAGSSSTETTQTQERLEEPEQQDTDKENDEQRRVEGTGSIEGNGTTQQPAEQESSAPEAEAENENKEEKEDNEEKDEAFPDMTDPSEEPAQPEEESTKNKESALDRARRRHQERIDNLSPEQKARRRGVANVGKKLVKPVYDIDRRGTGANAEKWKKIGKGALRMGVGAAVGTAAAAVQAGISITDGKYSPLEGAATFAAGYAGGGKVAKSIGGAFTGVSNAYKEGYYEGKPEGLQEKLREKQQKEFMASEENFKAYKNKYGSAKSAREHMQIAREHIVPYGYDKPKQHFQIQKMADHIIKQNQDKYDNLTPDQQKKYMEQAITQSRNTLGFMNQLESQGQKGIIRDPSKQKEYIKSEISSRGLDPNSDEAKKIEKSLNNAFRSAAVWYEVNK